MKQNQSAHQLIVNRDEHYLNAYDPATKEMFEWVVDPSSAWVFHPTNRKGKEMLMLVRLNHDSACKFVDRAEAIRNFNQNQS